MKQVYLILAAMMLLCLAPMPYGYFQLVRFVAMIAFGIMAYRYFTMNKTIAAWVFVVLAVLFQPIYKIVLGRGIWNMVDVIVAAFLIILFVIERKLEEKEFITYQPLPPDDQHELIDNSIEFKLEGRLAPNELIYVASNEDKSLTELFEKRPEILEGWGKMIGFSIVYLPLLMKRLKNKEVVQYRAPYLTDAELENTAIGNDYLLQYLEHPSDRERIQNGFIRTENIHKGRDGKDKAINRFYPITSHGSEALADQLHRIGKQISLENHEHERLLGNGETFDDWGGF